jgi:hypothetical protein
VVLLLSTSLAAQTTGTRSTRQGTKRRGSTAVTAEDLKALRELLEAQQQQIQELTETVRRVDDARRQSEEQLRQTLAAAGEAQSQAGAANTAATEQEESVTQLKSDVADIKTTLTNAAVTTQEEQKKFSALEGLVNRFRFGGDVRVRYENFFHGCPTCTFQPRHRARIRLRLGVEGKVNEDFSGGVYMATGSWENGIPSYRDPVSTNDTLTGFFERKAIGFDRGWITYNPRAHKWLSLTGGKFAYTWTRTPLSFDSDLNPEGFSQKLSFDVPSSVVRNFTLTGMQIFFSEAGGGADSFAVGGQVSSRLQLGDRVTVAPSYSLLNWRKANTIADAMVARTVTVCTDTTCTGTGTTNITTREVIVGGNSNTNVTTANRRAFLYRFLYSDLIVDTNIKTWSARFPLRILGEYEKNLHANPSELPVANRPADLFDPLTGQQVLGDQDDMYFVEVSLGQTRNRNDVQFGYSFARIERDAIIAAFVESDQRAATNVLQHRAFFQWAVASNTTIGYSLWIGRTLNSNLANAARVSGLPADPITGRFPTEPWLKRMQFDLVYKF